MTIYNIKKYKIVGDIPLDEKTPYKSINYFTLIFNKKVVK